MSFEASASLVAPGLVACQSVFNVARVQQNDNVLIHSAACSAGQIAVKLAEGLGAHVLVVSSSHKEEQFLIKDLGIPATRVFGRNSPSFSQDVMLATQGYGIDVVLDFSGGDALQGPMSSLATGARVITTANVERPAQSIIPMDLLARNMTLSVVDILSLNPKVMSQLTAKISQLFSDMEIEKMKSAETFTLSQVEDAIRSLQEVDSSGRAVVTVGSNDVVPVSHISEGPPMNTNRM
jgi:NADPH:quinone reductase-like Zn-dependent oxidoreductase